MSTTPPRVCRTLFLGQLSEVLTIVLQSFAIRKLPQLAINILTLAHQKIVQSLSQLLRPWQPDLECALAAILPCHTAAAPLIAVDDKICSNKFPNFDLNPMLLTVLDQAGRCRDHLILHPLKTRKRKDLRGAPTVKGSACLSPICGSIGHSLQSIHL